MQEMNNIIKMILLLLMLAGQMQAYNAYETEETVTSIPNGDTPVYSPAMTAENGNLNIRLPLIVAAQPEPFHLVLTATHGGEGILLFSDPHAMAWRFPLSLRWSDMNHRFPDGTTPGDIDYFNLYFLDAYGDILWEERQRNIQTVQ